MDYLEEKAYIFGSIFTLSNKLQSLGDRFDHNLTIKQWLLLASIFKCDSDSPTISEVAALIGNSRQNVKKMILILEKEGFVSLIKDSNDARILRVRFTKNCQDYLLQREKKESEFLLKLFEEFNSSEIELLVKSISKLGKNISQMESLYNYEEEE
ncbi:MAG: MarR family transcriptional regulator [Anaerocolumna sp.]|jgi:DNA-binding MarR family transcriptional regulator|nr:MarR family transcriptional regulator [Anaerocolumna sp.]